MIVFIDHQIGRFDPVASLRRMLPWLAYPNVHLAFIGKTYSYAVFQRFSVDKN